MRPGAPCAGSAPAPLLLTPFLLLLLAAVCTAVSASKYFLMFGCCPGSLVHCAPREFAAGIIFVFGGHIKACVAFVVFQRRYFVCLGE